MENQAGGGDSMGVLDRECQLYDIEGTKSGGLELIN